MEITPALRATRFSQLKPGELFIFPNDSFSVVSLAAADPSRDGDLCAIPLGPALPPDLIARIANLPGHTGVLSYGTEFIVQLPSRADGWPVQMPPPDTACFVLSEQGLYLRANFYPERPGFQACFVDMKDGKILTSTDRIRAEFLTPRDICGFAAEWTLLTRESEARVILSYPVAAHNSVCSVNIGVLRRPPCRGRHAYDPVCDAFSGLLPVSASGLSELEVLALRHQVSVLHRQRPGRVWLGRGDRLLWGWLYRVWLRCLKVMVLVKPATVIQWHRQGFRKYWRWRSSSRRVGRPGVNRKIRDLIRQMSAANPLWGAPRIHGEMLKLGIQVSQATVGRHMVRRHGPPSPTWRTFLSNQIDGIAAIDMFVVVTAAFRLLYVSVILGHARRKILHLNVTQHPTAGWLSRQITEAFPWDTAPRYLLRDRDASYGSDFRCRVEAMDITEVVTAPQSPWQNAYVERVIGSIRRECLDHVVVINERHLRRVLISYVDYYHHSRTHLSLDKDCPDARLIQPPNRGKVIAIPQVGGLHQRYERLAA